MTGALPSPDSIRIAVIGLGYVGLPLAVAFGKGRDVVGFDINTARIKELQAGRDSTLEVSPTELERASRLTFTSQAEDIADCNVYIVTVPTPIDGSNRPDLTPLCKASETIGSVLKPGDTVIYESTVYPGATEEDCVPVLEQHSGLKCISSLAPAGGDGRAAHKTSLAPSGGEGRGEEGFFVGYSPERINAGDRQHRITDSVKVTSGSTPEAAEFIDGLYASIITAGTHKVSSIKVAEAAKVIENTQRDLNIALINELSLIFERLGIDTWEVLEAAGTKWNFLPFRPGLVGGHCIGVDPYYLTHKAEAVGYHPQVILAGRRINDNMARYVARNTIKLMLKNGMDVPRCSIGVLGVSFKENCPDTRNSKIIDMIREFQAWGGTVAVTDPLADSAALHEEYGIRLDPVDPEHPVDALVVAVGHAEYRQLSAADLRQYVRGDAPVIADVKSLYDRRELVEAGFTVFKL